MKMKIAALFCMSGLSFGQSIADNPFLIEWANAANNDRADVVMLGDSNQLFGGDGWDGGWIRAMRNTVGIYATGIHWCGENNGFGGGTGEGFSTISVGSSLFQFSGVPSELYDYTTFGSQVSQYFYYPSGLTNGAKNWGMSVSYGLDTSASLRYWLTDATFPNSGFYQPVCRLGQSPFTQLVNFGLVSTGGGYGIRTSSYTLPSNINRTGSIQFLFTPYSFSNVLQAPFLPIFQRIEQVGAKGVSVHTFYSYGGKSGRYMSNVIKQSSDGFLTNWFSEARRLQGPNKHILVRINQGINDRGETLPSVKSNILPGNSPEAFADNISYTIDRINHVWEINGWDLGELCYVVDVSHAIATPQDSILSSYVSSIKNLTQVYSNLAVCDLSTFISSTEMANMGYYNSAIDHSHLSSAGYTELSRLEVVEILASRGICVADFNQDGSVDGDDASLFMSEWELGNSTADINGDGGVDGDDVSMFFAAWESGC